MYDGRGKKYEPAPRITPLGKGKSVRLKINNVQRHKLFSLFDRTNPRACWIWTGTTDVYGRFSINGKQYQAHVVVYVFFNGDYAFDIYDLHHKCRNKLCVNPAHLKQVTNVDHPKEEALARIRLRYTGVY